MLLAPFCAAFAFHLALLVPALNFLILVYAFSLTALSAAASPRLAFRLGFLAGLLVFSPQLAWFWKIFGFPAACLWAILSLFHGLYALGLQVVRTRWGARWLWLAAPILWTSLEYFRGELYFLRFSWLSAGYVFSGHAGGLPIGLLGVYGTGFAIFLITGFAANLPAKRAAFGLTLAGLAVGAMANWPRSADLPPEKGLAVAGIQLEFPPELEIPRRLDQVLAKYPQTDLLVLSEYTFDGEVPKRVRDWCRLHHKHLIAGGKRLAGEPGQFYNTAFVVGPDGEIIFEQAKSVPIQFFKDGLPAPQQRVWESPWGKIAICVCYDLSYRRVIDRFIGLGAQALIVPFMDIVDWGGHQHALHARVGSIRAQEYGIPIFRLGSSGLSQAIESNGQIVHQASFPGQEEIIAGVLSIGPPGRLPVDHILAPGCVILSSGFFLYFMFTRQRASPQNTLARVPGP